MAVETLFCLFFNGRAIKSLTPYSLMAVETFSFNLKNHLKLPVLYTPPVLMSRLLKKYLLPKWIHFEILKFLNSPFKNKVEGEETLL